MTTQDCKKSVTLPKKLSLRSALGVAARIVLLATPVWAMPLVDVAKSTIIFVSNFESGFSEWGKELCCTHSATIVTSPVRAGKQAIKFTLNKSDPDVASSKRVELKANSVPTNSDQWYGFSVFLPSSHVKDPTTEILSQWHQRPDTALGEAWSSPPLHFNTNNGNWRIHRRWDPNQVTKNNTPGPGGGSETVVIGSYQQDVGKWTDWVVHVKWSYKSDGLFELWKNGVLVLRKTGPNYYNNAQGTFQKMGVYKFDWKENPSKSNTTQRVVYFDEVRVGDAGSSYKDVSPGASPSPTPTPTPTPTPSPTPNPNPSPSPVGGIRVEAEQMFLSAYRIESGNSTASGGSLISLYNAPATTDTASSTFSGSSGKYDVIVGYFDEDDGVASLKVKLGGAEIASLQLNQKLGDGNASAKTLVRQKVASGVSINKGAKIEITGTANNTEWARVDYIEFIPVP